MIRGLGLVRLGANILQLMTLVKVAPGYHSQDPVKVRVTWFKTRVTIYSIDNNSKLLKVSKINIQCHRIPDKVT